MVGVFKLRTGAVHSNAESPPGFSFSGSSTLKSCKTGGNVESTVTGVTTVRGPKAGGSL
jgi:hypothetical protein